jgi:hypothetical protein
MCDRPGKSGRSPEHPLHAGTFANNLQAVLRCRFSNVFSAAFKASFCGELSSDSFRDASAENACCGRMSCFGGIVFSTNLLTCTFKRIALTCQPRCTRATCSLGNCCFSLAANAALGVERTSSSDSNRRTEQLSKIAGRICWQSRCMAAMRVTLGKSDASLSLLRKKSATPWDVFFKGVRVDRTPG